VFRGAPAKAVIADHWPLLRLGLSRVLASQDIRVVGESDDATAAIRMAGQEQANLLILGQLRGLTPVEAVRAAKAAAGRLRVLVMMGSAAPDDLTELLSAGADGLIGRMAGPDDVAAAVEQLLVGERFVAPTLLPALLGRVSPSTPPADAPADEAALTDKEREVLAFLARGGTNVEIARALYITPATVKTHIAHIYAKLGVKSRNAAVSRALELGLLT
jgi:DNA-binding NarL/FixJ family response regulator